MGATRIEVSCDRHIIRVYSLSNKRRPPRRMIAIRRRILLTCRQWVSQQMHRLTAVVAKGCFGNSVLYLRINRIFEDGCME